MAKNDKSNKGIIDTIQNLVSGLYNRTYYTSNDSKKVLDGLENKINSSLDGIIDNNISRHGANMSRLYDKMKLDNAKSMNKDKKAMDEIFNDSFITDGILETFLENKYIKDYDIEIDTVCKYMPKLEEAIDVKKEAILSADGFTKDFLNLKSKTKYSMQVNENFSNEVDEVKSVYKLNEKVEDIIYKTIKYGEVYMYVASRGQAIEDLLRNRNNNTQFIVKENTIITEGAEVNYLGNQFTDYDLSTIDINVNIDTSGYVESFVNESKIIHEVSTNSKLIGDKYLDTKMYDGLNTTQDGLIDPNKQKNTKVNISGAIVKMIPRENIIPIYIQDVCLGFYHIESNMVDTFSHIETITNPTNTINRPLSAQQQKKMDNSTQDAILKKISSALSKKIDAKFINSNQDLSNEIYLVLKHNQVCGNKTNITITYIPPSDIIHFYFKKDSNTHRGISDLHKSILPAKLYSALYITNTIGLLTRSQDKRAYFVKQYIDSNISEVLLNVINQIKKGNFGMREISGVNNVFNMIGRFNDHVIPISQSNEKPIDFEVIPGQNIDTKPEFMEKLESMAINPTGTPMELLEARRTIEFSRQITTANGTFARHILGRQNIINPMLQEFITRVYNLHFNKKEEIDITLPPPSFLTITNTVEMIDAANRTKDGIIAATVPQTDMDQPWVQTYANNIMRYNLSSYVNWSDMERLKEVSKIQANISDIESGEGTDE